MEAPAVPAAPDRRLLGTLLICVATLCFCGADTMAKVALNAGTTPLVVTWGRYWGSMLILLALVPALGWRRVAATLRPGLHLARGLVVLGSSLLFFHGLQHLPLADTFAIGFASPIWVALMAAAALGERVSWRRWLAIGAGFAGVLVIVRPGGEGMGWLALLPLSSSLLFAAYQVLTRAAGASEPPLVSLFWAMLVGTVAMSLLVPFAWETPKPEAWLVFLGIGLFAFVGHLAMTKAYAIAPAAHLAPFYYSVLIWATLSGWVAFGDVPDLWTFVGAGILAVTGVFVVRLKD
ncbi:MAG: DMT family transporter [Alphaproteobacteria bacterium]|nr:DMT family transporter [Alphaproteobacteria bacterium]